MQVMLVVPLRETQIVLILMTILQLLLVLKVTVLF